MKDILKRWYVGLVIIPLLINYLTSYISLPDILKDWKTIIIISEFIFILILTYELWLTSKKKEPKKVIVKEADRQIVKDLMDTLDINIFQRDIYQQDSIYGYRKNAIGNVIDFIDKGNRIAYQTTDEKLNNLLNDFKISLETFTELSSRELFGLDKDWYSPEKSTDIGKQKIEQSRPMMNQMTTDSFEKLKPLLKYIKDKEYL